MGETLVMTILRPGLQPALHPPPPPSTRLVTVRPGSQRQRAIPGDTHLWTFAVLTSGQAA